MSGQENEPNANHAAGSSTLQSKIVFFAMIAVIIAGTSFWYLLTLWASETPLGPEIAKQYAEEFEHECFLSVQDEEQCKKLIGANHRDCLFENIEQVAPGTGDNGGNVEHDRAGYMACMRETTGVSY